MDGTAHAKLLPFDALHDGPNCVSVTWRAISYCPHRVFIHARDRHRCSIFVLVGNPREINEITNVAVDAEHDVAREGLVQRAAHATDQGHRYRG